MALIVCPDCNKEVSDKSKICIHCGCPLNNKNTMCIINGKSYDLSFILDSPINNITDKKEKKFQAAYLCRQLADMLGCIGFDVMDFVDQILETHEVPQSIYFDFLAEAEQKTKEEANKPKCPTCGSTNISPIGNLERAASMWFWGLGSKKFGKSYKCNDCKHTW